ncbi:MAG: M20/M25/M40 family metallo-hydrolase [Methanobacteriota archaeon]|nr:MAG: M20/M25/M40 family metallo-hydrolase [Euryarchaeota archaeon]
MSIESLHAEIDRLWPKHLSETRRMLRIPSVSMTGEGIQETAEALSEMLSEMGTKARLFRAGPKSHPLVAGRLDVGAKRTGIVYGMYDVQPVGDLEAWDHPPFEATIVRKKPHGEVLINRGVCNSKGSLVGNLLAFKTMLDKGELPVNLEFVLEGEEELGGPSFPKYIHKNKAKLSKADFALGLDYGENSKGVPMIALGLKGCVYFDLTVRGSERGGPTKGEIHSSDAVIVESPVWRLVKALNTLVDEDQDPAVDGLWDSVREPSEEDLALLKKLVKVFDAESYAGDIGVKRFKVKGSKQKLLRKYLFEPSLNIDGVIAGYTEEGTKTVLPDSAKAKIDVRLVPDMTIEETRAKIMAHLRRRGFTDIEMRNYEDYPWSKVSVNETISQASIAAMRYHGKEPEVWPLTAGSAPFYLFDQVLGIPWGGAGLGHAGRPHAPNEYAVVKGMKDFEKSAITLVCKYVEMADCG